MDTISILEDPRVGSITVRSENRFIDFTKPRELRWSNAHQQELYPGDKGLEFTADLADKEIHWGRPNIEKEIKQSGPY